MGAIRQTCIVHVRSHAALGVLMLLRMLLLLLRHCCSGLHTIHWDSTDMGTCLKEALPGSYSQFCISSKAGSPISYDNLAQKSPQRKRPFLLKQPLQSNDVIIIPAVQQIHYICKMEAAFETATSSEAGARQVVHERGRDTRAESPLAAAAAVG